ncbi:hypothetical protein MYAM1_002126 [Malassezia yamatoensis]|uniref:triacylglycerol lipase n=1 Tax=Malassezia yamatoensis TaxID=253288 RepID=A0AAJ5YXF2_9BASI|nr:hypothetical protein MYAM1_002126 [Malassezia yamatoensis]
MYSTGLARWLVLAVVAILPLVSALGLVPYPDQDPFYYPPSGWQNQKPGAILRSRKVQTASVGILRYNLNSWQLLFRSNANNAHSPSYTVTTVLVPHNADKGKMVTISSPENANWIRCAPSYAFRYTGVLELTNFEPRWEQTIYTLFLAEGWVVNAPDHEGPSSAFAAGIAGGHMVLDSMRATLNSKQIGMSKNAMLIGHGYSGGSIPNGWAAGLQPTYAPELNIVGWSLGGTASDPAMTLNFLDGSPTAALVLVGAVGLIDGYRDEIYDLFQNEIWTDEGKQAVAVAHAACIYEMVFLFMNQTIQSPRYIKGGRNLTSYPSVAKIMGSLVMGSNPKYVPKHPIFMFHAAYDEEIVWYQANTTAVNWCEQGANIRFLTQTSTALNHVATYLLDVPYIINFMRDRFAGKSYYNGGCQFDSSSEYPLYDASILGERLQEAMEAILDLLGKEIGPKDSILQAKIHSKQNPNKVGLTHLPGMKSTTITPGEGGNDSPASKAVRKTGKTSDSKLSTNSSTHNGKVNQTSANTETSNIHHYNGNGTGAGQGNN